MKINYPIINPIEVRDYNKAESIDMTNLPTWLMKEMEKIAKIENCNTRELEYKRHLYYDPDKLRWIDSGIISYESKN